MVLKGKSGQKIIQTQLKEHEKVPKNEPSLNSMYQMVLEISHSKVRNLSKMDIPIFLVLASSSHKYDVTVAILQNNEKMRLQYLRSLLFDLFAICRLLELSKGILLDFKFPCYGNQNQSNFLLWKNNKVYCLSKRYFSKNDLKQCNLIITAGNIFFRKILVIHSSYC